MEITLTTCLGMTWNNIASLGTLISGVATLVIAWFTYRAARISKISAHAAKKAANNAELSIEVARESYAASERPWVSVDAEVSTSLVKEDHGIDFGVNFTVQNYGRSPALNVHVFYKVITLKITQDQFSGTRQKVYDHGKSGAGENMGVPIFPDERKVIPWRSFLSNEEIRSVTNDITHPSGLLPAFYIIGSVFYKSVFKEDLYHTDFIYSVEASGVEEFPHGCDVPDFEKTFPRERVHLIPQPYYKGTIC